MRRKTVALPGGLRDLDIRPILPIVDTPQFQRLRYINQLGLSSIVFLGARHTRFDHLLGTYALTQERAENWCRDGWITHAEAIDLSLFGLLHDIGHGPYSHAIEGACHNDHNVNGLRILEQLRSGIEACGSTVERIHRLFTREHPLAAGVSHRPLGTDKLNYLIVDGDRSTEAVAIRPGDILNYTWLEDGRIVVDEKIVPEVRQVEQAYTNMYLRVYFRKTTLIVQLFLQQIVARALAISPLPETQLFDFTDDDLNAWLLSHSDKIVRQLFNQLRTRRLPKVAFSLLTPPGGHVPHRDPHKPRYIWHCAPERLASFEYLATRDRAALMEVELAALLGLSPHEILVVAPVPVERFMPEPVLLDNGSRGRGCLHTLFPQHRASLLEAIHSETALHICVPADQRERVANSQNASNIQAYLEKIN